MKSKLTGGKRSAEHMVKDIRRATRRHFSSEDKIRIVLDGLRGDDSVAEFYRKEGENAAMDRTFDMACCMVRAGAMSANGAGGNP